MNICLVYARQCRHVVLRHGAFCVSRRIFMFYSWKADVFIHRLWNNVYDRWITSNFSCKWHRIASRASGCKFSPRKIFHRNSSRERRFKFIGKPIEEDNREEERTSLITGKATSSTQRPQTCAEAGTKYYNNTVNETDEEREHRLSTLQKATRSRQRLRFTVKIIFFDEAIDSKSYQGHPTTVFCEISVRRSKYCPQFSITWGRSHSCTRFSKLI